MTRLVPVIIGLTFSTLSATAALAQTCTGTASFASGPVRVGAGIDAGTDSKQYGAQAAVGRAAGPFASGSVVVVDLDEIDENGTLYAAELGYGIRVAASKPFEVCPIAGIGFGSVDVGDGGLGVEISSRQLQVGLSIGAVASTTPTFAFVPAMAVFYANENVESKGAVEFDESDDYGVITLAAGLVFNQRVTLRPNLAFPVGLDDADPMYGVAIAFNFGSAPSSRQRPR